MSLGDPVRTFEYSRSTIRTFLGIGAVSLPFWSLIAVFAWVDGALIPALLFVFFAVLSLTLIIWGVLRLRSLPTEPPVVLHENGLIIRAMGEERQLTWEEMSVKTSGRGDAQELIISATDGFRTKFDIMLEDFDLLFSRVRAQKRLIEDPEEQTFTAIRRVPRAIAAIGVLLFAIVGIYALSIGYRLPWVYLLSGGGLYLTLRNLLSPRYDLQRITLTENELETENKDGNIRQFKWDDLEEAQALDPTLTLFFGAESVTLNRYFKDADALTDLLFDRVEKLLRDKTLAQLDAGETLTFSYVLADHERVYNRANEAEAIAWADMRDMTTQPADWLAQQANTAESMRFLVLLNHKLGDDERRSIY